MITYSKGKQLSLVDRLSQSVCQLLHLVLSLSGACLQVSNHSLQLLLLLLWELIVLFLLLLFHAVFVDILAVGKRQLNGNAGQILEELLGFLVRQIVVQLGIDHTPEGTLLRDTCLVLAVQEGDVEHLLRDVSSVIAHLFVLEVGVLHVPALLELLYVDSGLTHCGPPAVICQGDAVSESLDGALEDLKEHILDAKLTLKLADELLFLAWDEAIIATWPHVVGPFAHVAPRDDRH